MIGIAEQVYSVVLLSLFFLEVKQIFVYFLLLVYLFIVFLSWNIHFKLIAICL